MEAVAGSAAARVSQAAAPGVAPAAAAAAALPGGMAALIEQREQELAQLRVDSLRALEQQLGQRDGKIRELQSKMSALQADFEYNLGLLEGRDTELAGAEASLAAARSELASKVQLIQQMQAALAEAEQALEAEATARAKAESQLVQERRALVAEVQSVQAAGHAVQRELQRQADTQRRQLEAEGQRAAKQAAEQAAAQATAHAEEVQRLQAEHAERLQEVHLRAEVAEALGARREADLQAANKQLQSQAAQLAALQAQLESRGGALAAAEEGRVQAVQQLQAAQREHTSQASELRSTAHALRSAFEDQRADGAEQLRRVQEQLGVQAQAALAEAEAARLQAAQLGEELGEARAALEVQHAALQQQLEAICADKERQLAAALGTLRDEHAQEQQQLEAALAEAQRSRDALQQRHAVLQELVEQQVEELATAQGETAGWAGQREQLQAQLDAAERRAAVLAAGQGPSLPELEGMLRRLTGQRGTAQVAAAEAQAKLANCEAELHRLRQQVASAEEGHQNQDQGSETFSWPTPLSTETLEVSPAAGAVVKGAPEGLADRAAAAAELAVLQAALVAERQQSQQLQAALHALTADIQQLQEQRSQQQQQQQLAIVPTNSPGGDSGGGQALADVTNRDAAGMQQRDVQWLSKQLSKAQSCLRQLAAENERLMELSNSLRAERNRLAATAAEQQAAESQGGSKGSGAVQGPVQWAPQQAAPPALPMFAMPPSLWPLLALPTAGRMLAIAEPAAGSPQQLEKQLCSAAQQLTASPCSAHDPAALLQAGAQNAVKLAACTGTAAEPVAVVGTRLPEAGKMPPSNASGARTKSCGATGRRPLPAAPQREQREQQAERAKAPSPPRVRNYNVKSP